MIERIARASLADQVHQRLIDAFLDGRFGPGDRLVMDPLAAELGVSRTPVRDALARLEHEGVIEGAPRGYVVRSVTDADVAAIYQARSAVEGYAARLVSATDGAMTVIEATLDDIAERDASRPVEAFWANRALHRSIVAATGNAILVSCFDSIWNTSVAAYAFGQIHRQAGLHADIVAGHRDLLAALAAGGPNEAEAAMLAHLDEGRNRQGY